MTDNPNPQGKGQVPVLATLAETSAGSVEVPRVDVTEDTLKAHDVAVLLTDHDDFPYEAISAHVSAVVDARNGFENGADKENVWLLGGGGNRSSE